MQLEKENYMSAAFYIVQYQAAMTGGLGVYIGNGIIAGVDVANIRYDGHYTEASDGTLSGTVMIKAPASTQLVTGATLPANHPLDVPFSIPSGFGDGRPVQFMIAGQPVTASFEKLRDLP
ncbi:hypothetical protein [Neorhizobium sp. DAR64872/K0K18]|uniref:hypothetical protein n=1 Tax=Neorhizobium sp. DAR64872/K0K18 TaxID=3421958 RepID=UPI003D281C10